MTEKKPKPKKTHGGARPGAGRPAQHGPTVMRRIPVWLAEWMKADPTAIEQIRKIGPE